MPVSPAFDHTVAEGLIENSGAVCCGYENRNVETADLLSDREPHDHSETVALQQGPIRVSVVGNDADVVEVDRTIARSECGWAVARIEPGRQVVLDHPLG